MPVINYKEAAAKVQQEYGLIPEGSYLAEVVGAEYSLTKANQYPNFCLTFQVLSGPYMGRKLFTNIVFAPKSTGYFFQKFAALGLTAEWFERLPDEDVENVICREVVGRQATLAVGQSEYRNEMRNEVKAIDRSVEPARLSVIGVSGAGQR